MIHPDGTLYGQVGIDDVQEIVEQHIEKGKVVERLALMELRAETRL
jgi:(2Fe-2S) ferredoxin